MSLNRVFIMGNLGQDPELRFTPTQTPVVTMSIATTEFRAAQDGQRQELTEWHRVVVWGKQAENCAKYLKKGRPVFVEGRLQTRSWEDKNGGGKRYSTEVIANNVRFMGGAKSEGSGDYASSGPVTGGFTGPSGPPDEQSFGGGTSGGQGNFESAFGGPLTPNVDEVPF